MSVPERQPTVSRRAVLAGAVGGAGSTQATERSAAQTDGETVTVEMTDGFVFAPEEIRVRPGTTVVWENVGAVGHSVTAYEDRLPDGAAYFASGGFESESAARSGYPGRGNVAGGERYQHTFEVEGEYGYFCIPHEGVGMVGSVLVTTETPAPAGEPLVGVPDVWRQLGIAAGAAMLAILGLSLFLMKYGGNYEGG